MNVVTRAIRSSFTPDLGKSHYEKMSLRPAQFNDASPFSSSSKFSFLSFVDLRHVRRSFSHRQLLMLLGSSLHLGQEHGKYDVRRLDVGESGLGSIWCNFWASLICFTSGMDERST